MKLQSIAVVALVLMTSSAFAADKATLPTDQKAVKVASHKKHSKMAKESKEKAPAEKEAVKQ